MLSLVNSLSGRRLQKQEGRNLRDLAICRVRSFPRNLTSELSPGSKKKIMQISAHAIQRQPFSIKKRYSSTYNRPFNDHLELQWHRKKRLMAVCHVIQTQNAWLMACTYDGCGGSWDLLLRPPNKQGGSQMHLTTVLPI